MTNKKITILIDSLRGGGAERVCTTVASGLAENGYDVSLVVVDLKGAAYLNYLSDKVCLVDLNSRQIYSALKLYRFFKKNKTDRVVVFNHQLTVISVLLKKIFFLKIEIISRNINTLSKITDLDYQEKPFKKWLVNRFYKEADFFVNQCRAMEADLLSLYPELKGKTSVIYNPVAHNIEGYISKSEIFNTPKEDFLLCVGRLSKQKSFHLAILAFSKVYKEYPGMRLKIVGQGLLEKELKDLAAGLEISNSVDFEGFQGDVISYYLKAKVVLLTSEFEGFPNVLIESITLGTPVVSFDIQSGPSEIIKDGLNGYLVNKGDVDLFAEKIKLVLQSDFPRKDLHKTVSFAKNKEVMKKWNKLLAF